MVASLLTIASAVSDFFGLTWVITPSGVSLVVRVKIGANFGKLEWYIWIEMILVSSTHNWTVPASIAVIESLWFDWEDFLIWPGFRLNIFYWFPSGRDLRCASILMSDYSHGRFSRRSPYNDKGNNTSGQFHNKSGQPRRVAPTDGLGADSSRLKKKLQILLLCL